MGWSCDFVIHGVRVLVFLGSLDEKEIVNIDTYHFINCTLYDRFILNYPDPIPLRCCIENGVLVPRPSQLSEKGTSASCGGIHLQLFCFCHEHCHLSPLIFFLQVLDYHISDPI